MIQISTSYHFIFFYLFIPSDLLCLEAADVSFWTTHITVQHTEQQSIKYYLLSNIESFHAAAELKKYIYKFLLVIFIKSSTVNLLTRHEYYMRLYKTERHLIRDMFVSACEIYFKMPPWKALLGGFVFDDS